MQRRNPHPRGTHLLRAAILALLVLLAPALPGFAGPGPGAPQGWADPHTIAETRVAAPPALIFAGGLFHLFWLDAESGLVVVRHGAVDASGTVRIPVQRLAVGADTRFGWPVAAAAGGQIVAAWMARTGAELRLMVAVVDTRGEVINPPHPVGPPAEEAGRIAILAQGGRIHLVWSQFDHGQRRVRHLPLTPAGAAIHPARPVAPGDAPAIVPGAGSLLWWHPVGFDTYRLTMATISDDGLTAAPHQMVQRAARAITGTVSLSKIVPVIPVPGAGTLDLLLPIVERAFGTAGRLYHLRVTGEGASPRRLVLGFRSVADVTVASAHGLTTVAWVEAVGRKRNSEIFAAIFDPQSQRLAAESRITLSPSGSVRPAVAAGPTGWAAAWLEVAGFNQFKLSFAMSSASRRDRILLGIPELDLFHPGRLITFSMTVLASVLPYAALFAIAFGLPAASLGLLGAAVFGSFRWWERVQTRPVLRLALLLALTLIFQLIGRALILGRPGGPALVISLSVVGVAALSLPRRWQREPLGFWGIAGLALLLQMLAVLFPWGARILSQF